MQILVSQIEIKRPMEIKIVRPIWTILLAVWFTLQFLTLAAHLEVTSLVWCILDALIVVFIALGK